MFYVFVAIGAFLFIAGMLLVPGWWKLAWVVGWVALLAYLPTLLARILDPFNAKRIQVHCASVGVTEVEVKPFPNHYGVHFTKNQRKHYAKCTVVWGRVNWKGPSPGEV